MLKKAKIAFLLVIALVFAVQGIGMDTALAAQVVWTKDQVTKANLVEGMGIASTTGVLTESFVQASHSEANVIADVVYHEDKQPFLISGRGNAAMGYDLEAVIELPIYHFADTMTFRVYTYENGQYVKTNLVAEDIDVEGKTEVVIDFGQVKDPELFSKQLYVFQEENGKIVPETGMNMDAMTPDYGDPVSGQDGGFVYIGSLQYNDGATKEVCNMFQTKNSEWNGPNGERGYISDLHLGPTVRLYRNIGDTTPMADSEGTEADADKVYIRDSSWPEGEYALLTEVTYKDGSYLLYGENKFNVVYEDTATMAKDALVGLSDFSWNLANSELGLGGTLAEGVHVGDTPKSTGNGTHMGTMTDDVVVTLYRIDATGGNVTQSNLRVIDSALNNSNESKLYDDGLPIADNEYVVFNVVVPAGMDKVSLKGAVLTYKTSSGEVQVADPGWKQGKADAMSRVIWNIVQEKDGKYVPFEGTVENGQNHGGVILAPKATINVTATANANILVAKTVVQSEGMEIHQLSFNSSTTKLRMRNTHPVTVEGSKTWNDEGHTDKRPESIEVTLYAAYYNEGYMGYGSYGTPQAIKTITVTAEDNWSWSFEGLPKYDDNTRAQQYGTPGFYIQYTVEEKAIPSYAQTTTAPGQIGSPVYDLNITNTYDEKIIVIEGEKIWDDANDQDGKRPDSITVTLQGRYKRGGSAAQWSDWDDLSEFQGFYGFDDTITVDADDDWKWNFGSVKKSYGEGENRYEWQYRVIETRFGNSTIRNAEDLISGGDIKTGSYYNSTDTGYDVSYSNKGTEGTKAGDPYNITNSHTPEKTEISGTKVWVPATVNKTEVTVNLYIVNADGTETDTGLTAKANEANNWTWSFTDLDKYKDGVEIQYTVKENNAPQGFWSEVVKNEDGITVYNIAKDVKLKGKKVWKDQNGAEMNPPNSASGGVQIEVYRRDGKLMAEQTVGSWTDWAWSFELPGLMPDGITDAEYYVKEAFVPNYTSTPVEGEEGEEGNYKVLNWTVTNTHKPISIKVTKVWVDDENESGMRPTELKLYLKRRTDSSQNWQDATDSNHQPIVAVLDVANGQTEYTFTNLPEYDDNGNKYEYYVEELTSNYQPPVGYTPSYDTDTDDAGNIDYTLTNTINKVSISGTKTWNGLEARETHPTSVNLKVMYHNGTEYVVYPTTTNTITGGERENSWNWTISDLPEYINGQKVTYTVEEEVVFGYDSSVSGDMTNGFAVTNTKKEVGRIRLYKESDSETEERTVGNETIVARKRLDGAVFRLYSDEACQNEVLTDHEKYPFTTASTGSEKGKLTIENVPYGTYWLKEVETPEGYTLYGDGVYKVVVNAATADVIGDAENEDYQGNNPVSNVVLNKKITGDSGSIALIKTDADTGEKLSGAVFTVYSDEACNTSVGTMTVKDATNNPGVYTMENLPAGTYYVKETAPEGYRQPAADHKYTVTVQAGKVINVANGSEFVAATATPITNKAITSVSVEKVWANVAEGTVLPGIQVQLYNGSTPVGNPVNLPITLEDNTQSWSYTWNDLDKYVAGTDDEIVYTVDEVSVPDNYIKTVTTNGNAVTITNKYVAETEVTLSAKKTLNGADYTGDEFTFVLEGNSVNETVSSVNGGVVTFPKITYTLADLKNADGTLKDSATFTYTISEEEGSAAGVTYDDTIYTAVVTLTYNAQTGELEHSVAYTKNAGAADEEVLAQDEVPVFANTSIELVSVSVTKEWKHGTNISTNWPSQIQVVLTVDGVADYNRMVRLPVNNNDWSYTWPDLPKYGIDEDGKQYEIDYSVMENSVPNDYVSKLSAKAKNDYVITNTYVENNQELELTFPVTKMVKGSTTDELFTFKLEARPSSPPAPMPEGAELGSNGYNYITTQTAGTAAGTTVNFDTIKVTSAKVKEHGQYPPYYVTYGWKISEVIPENKNPNIIYDEGWYEILVNFCIDEDGKLAIGERDIWDEDWENILGQEPDVTITHYDAEGNSTKIPYNDGEFALPFTNTYFAPAQVNLAAKKTLNDAAYDGTAYSFQLKKDDNIVETVTEVDNGTVAFAPIEFTLADMKNTDGTIAAEKTFTYTISEVIPEGANEGNNYTLNGVTYDNTVYTAEVKVTCDVSTGTLNSSVVYKKDGTPVTLDKLLFANTTEKVNVSVTKVWNDNNDEAKKRPKDIQVQLLNGEDVVNTVTLPYNGSWNYTWTDLLKYEEGKTEPIEYTVAEVTKNGETDLPWVADYIPGEPSGDMEKGFTITNTYVSAKTEITLTKKLDGQPSATEFDFTLTPKTEGDKNQAATVKNSATGGIVFTLAYGKADMGQTYVYEIAETPVEDYYCDNTVYTVTVVVGDEANADGTLPLTVTYKKGNEVVEAADLLFENASAITAELPVQKTLTTNNVDDVVKTYSFTLTPTYQGATEAEQTIDVTVDGTASPLTGSNKFELSFAAPGTYTYTVAETVASELPGYTYDKSVYTVTYEVEMANGKLQVKAGYPQITLNGTAADELAFTNDYEQEAGSATLHANKVFTNGDLTATQFTFALLAADGTTPITDADGKAITAISNALGEVTFPALHYDVAGTYNYVIKEQIPTDQGGIVYDGKSVAVKVKVVKVGNQLTATVEYNDTATAPTFTNEQLKTTIELTANKEFNGTLTDGQFTFELLDEDGTTPIEDANGQPITATNAADGSIAFPELTYTAPGEYKYTIKEQIPAEQGNIVYDDHSAKATVTVVRGENGLTATVTYEGGAAEFTNEQLSTTGKVYVKKNFADNKTAAGDYTFTITPVDGAPALTTNTLTLTFGDTTTEASGVFQLPTYTAPGTYTYTVEESTATKNANVEYDSKKYTVAVTVARVNDELVATVTTGNKQITEQEPIVFTNTVLTTSLSGTKVWAKDKETDRPAKITIRLLANGKATGDICELASDKTAWSFTDLPVNDENGEITYTVSEDAVPGYATSISGTTITNTKIADGQAVIQARKVLNGATLQEGQFTFQLLDAGGNVVDEKTNDANGLITFTAITYDMDDMKDEDGKKVAEKTFTYTIKEVIPATKVEGYTYDETAHPVTVTVTEDTTNHKLNAVVDYGRAGGVVFTNTYSETEVALSVTKELVHSSDLPQAAAFTFTLKDSTDKVLDSKTLTFDAQSESVQTVSFDKITYKTAGTYTYTVTETPAADTAITSDATVYQVTVDVKATENGLQQTTTIKADGEEASAIKFTNTYNATVDVTGTKVWVGDNAAERPESITLTLYADGTEQTDKTPVFTDTDKDTWQWSFTDLPKYNAAGNAITYTVSEDAVPGYATSISGTTITNTKIADGQAVIQARKVLNGATLQEGQFTFQLLDAGGNVVDEKTNDANGLITFTAITYDMDDMKDEDGKKVAEKTFTYTIKEVIPTTKVEGYTYDETAHPVTVTVTEDTTDHKLNATVDYGKAGEVVFTNTYSETEVILSVTKELVHSSDLPKAATFTFTLKDGAGKVLDSKTLTFDAQSESVQTVSFDKITYKTAGTYTYTVTETPAADTAITSDATVYQVTVDVKATENGLQQTTTIKADGEEASAIKFTNTYNATVDVTGTKVWVGDNAAERPESITLTLYADGTEQTDKTPVFTDTDKDTWQWSFTDLPKYNAAGNAITYTVSEGEVSGYVTEISGTTITNTKIADGQAVIQAKKVLNGVAPAEGQFTFQLLKGGTVVDTKANDATGMVTFKTLEYSDEAEETYTIVEVLPAGATAENNYTVNGMTYDPAQHTAKVKVVQDDASKKLVATVTYDGTSTEAPVFANTYTVTGTTLTLSLSKTLENSAKLPEDRTETFTFVLADAAGATKDEATVTFTKTRGETQTVAFDTLTFDAEGTYTYTITETASTKDDIITDTTKYYLEVKVEDVNGQLVATKTLTKQTGAEEATSAEAIEFTNTYDFDKFGELTLAVTKAMSGRAFQSGDSFTFTVTGDNGAPMPENTEVTINPTSGTTAAVDFGKISFTEADVGKTYTYTITESKGNQVGVTYDTTGHTVEVEITEGAEALIVTPTYADGESVIITNRYLKKDGELTLNVTKAMSGRAFQSGDSFTFTVSGSEGAPMPENATVIIEPTSGTTAAVDFGKIGYTEADVGKTYTYTIQETEPAEADKLPSVTYDTTEYTVTVKVDEGAEALVVTPTYANGEGVTITNTYAANGKLLLTGTKTVTGDSTVAEHTFTFGVFDQSGKEVATGTNDATGNITFTEIAYTLDQVGSHAYTVKETATVAQAVADKYIVKLDETEYTILVNVVNNAATGNLDVTWSISQPAEASALDFTNDFQLRVGNIGVVKVDSNDNKKGLSGAEFTVYTDEACTTILMLDGEKAIITTGATGAGALDGLPIGTYWVKETKAPQHYLLDEETVYEVTVVEGDRAMVNDIHVTNKKMAKLALEKSDRLNPDKKLPDAEYTLFTEEACEEEDILVLPDGTKAIITTGEDGVGELEGVPAGTYWVKETKAPTGYEVDPIPYKVIVPEEEDPENPVFVAVSDFPLRGALSLSKTVVASSEVTDTFLFDIELTLETDDPIVGSYKATLNGAETEDVTFTATETGAKATVELKDGETMAIHGLRAGVSYTVTEQPNSRYDVTVNGEEATSATGTISDTALSIVKYQNTLKETGFTVKKEWSGLAEGEKAPAIQLTLYCNGKVYTAATPTPDKDGWYTYADLPAYVDGQLAVYTVKEEPVTGFTTTYINKGENAAVTDCAYNGSTIVNSKIPQTGDNAPLTLWMLTTLLAACGLMGVMVTLRKREN